METTCFPTGRFMAAACEEKFTNTLTRNVCHLIYEYHENYFNVRKLYQKKKI